MLRTTSPHAASVVSSARLIPSTSVAQLALVHDVELHALAGRQAHRAVGEVGDPVERQPLLAAEPAARNGRPDHARVVERQLLRRPLTADVAVVLLVDAVELEHDLVVVAEGVGAVGRAPRRSVPRRKPLARLMSSTVMARLPPTGDRRDDVQAALGLGAAGPAAGRGSSPGDTGRVHGQQPIDA